MYIGEQPVESDR